MFAESSDRDKGRRRTEQTDEIVAAKLEEDRMLDKSMTNKSPQKLKSIFSNFPCQSHNYSHLELNLLHPLVSLP